MKNRPFCSFTFAKLLILLGFVAFFFAVSAEDAASPTADISFVKSGKGVVYTIVFGKNTKFNDNPDAPYKFIFLDSGKKELGRIAREFFVKNREGKVEYTSVFNESSVKITLPACLYNPKTGEAEKCTLINKKLEIK